MKKKLLLLLILTSLYGCSSEDTTLPESEITTIINNEAFIPDELHAFNIFNTYLFAISNSEKTILLASSDTISGTYNMISIKDINLNIDNDSLFLDIEALENNPQFQEKNLGFGAFVQNDESYFTTSGSLTLSKNKDYTVSGEFNIQLISENQQIIDIQNGVFNNLKAQTLTLTPDDVNTEENEEELNNYFKAIYNELESLIQYQFLFDAFYTNQINHNSLWNDVKNHNINSKNQILEDFWQKHFSFLSHINKSIKIINNVYANNEIKRKQKLAEIYTLRAHIYSSISNWFGNAPIILNELDLSEELPEFRNTTEMEAQIITDLNFAISNLHLPATIDNNIINKDYSRVLLARIYFRQKEYTKLIQVLEPIVTENNYTLSNTTIELTKQELIFNINIDEEINSSIENDFQKHVNTTSLNLAKYSEVLLLLSESYNQIDDLETSKKYINQLKKRVNESVVTTNNKNELSEIIFNQYYIELNLDGNRFQALKSYNKAINSLNIEAHQLILPIPISEIEVNPKATQNPGY